MLLTKDKVQRKNNIFRVIESVVQHFPAQYRKMLNDISTTRRFDKEVYILEEGKYCNHLWFINKGAVRAFEPVKGNERVTYFFLDNMFFTNYFCWVTAKPSDITFQTVEQSEIVVIDYPKLEALCTKHHIFDTIGRKIAQYIAVDEFQLRKLLLNYSAAERYDYLESERPEIFQRFALKDIASFIGITDVSLSRIRRERLRK